MANSENLVEDLQSSGNDTKPLVLRRFSVALVFQKHTYGTIESLLLCSIEDACSEEEALGKAIIRFAAETKEHNLAMRCVLKMA